MSAGSSNASTPLEFLGSRFGSSTSPANLSSTPPFDGIEFSPAMNTSPDARGKSSGLLVYPDASSFAVSDLAIPDVEA